MPGMKRFAPFQRLIWQGLGPCALSSKIPLLSNCQPDLTLALVLILAVSIMPIIPSRRNHTPLLDARTRITNHNRREHIYLVIEHLLQGGEPHLLLWTIGIAN